VLPDFLSSSSSSSSSSGSGTGSTQPPEDKWGATSRKK
jgi:hypothetical protein